MIVVSDLDKQLMQQYDTYFYKIYHIIKLIKICSRETEYFLSHPKFQRILHSGLKFDLIIIDNCVSYAFLGVSHHFGAHTIMFSTMGLNQALSVYTRNPFPTSYVPLAIFPFSDRMSFLQRCINSWSNVFLRLLEYYSAVHKHRTVLKRHFPRAGSLDDLLKNVSLVFANSHFVVESPRPKMPMVKQVGGLHIKKPKKLPVVSQT